jgi:hypothetical protein
MTRPNKLQLHILKTIKGESLARMWKRVSKGVREYNGWGIRTNWIYQAEAGL